MPTIQGTKVGKRTKNETQIYLHENLWTWQSWNKEEFFKMEELEGYEILAESLARNGLKYMFGVVGIPVVEIAIAAQRCGIHYIGK